MAHWDHLGLTDEGKDKIYNGAVDNATGVAGIIELARLFKNMDTAVSIFLNNLANSIIPATPVALSTAPL